MDYRVGCEWCGKDINEDELVILQHQATGEWLKHYCLPCVGAEVLMALAKIEKLKHLS